MNLLGVEDGGISVVGVAVPESGYAGEGCDGCCEKERDARMPLRIAIPRVPQPRTVSVVSERR